MRQKPTSAPSAEKLAPPRYGVSNRALTIEAAMITAATTMAQEHVNRMRISHPLASGGPVDRPLGELASWLPATTNHRAGW